MKRPEWVPRNEDEVYACKLEQLLGDYEWYVSVGIGKDEERKSALYVYVNHENYLNHPIIPIVCGGRKVFTRDWME